jgi:hypothetical protein
VAAGQSAQGSGGAVGGCGQLTSIAAFGVGVDARRVGSRCVHRLELPVRLHVVSRLRDVGHPCRPSAAAAALLCSAARAVP